MTGFLKALMARYCVVVVFHIMTRSLSQVCLRNGRVEFIGLLAEMITLWEDGFKFLCRAR